MFECDLIGLKTVFVAPLILGPALLCIVLAVFGLVTLCGIKTKKEDFTRLVLLISIPVTLFSLGLGKGSTYDCDTLELRYIFYYTLLIGDILLALFLLFFFRFRKKGLKISKPTSLLAILLFLVNVYGWVYAFRIHNLMPERNCEPPGNSAIQSCIEKIKR